MSLLVPLLCSFGALAPSLRTYNLRVGRYDCMGIDQYWHGIRRQCCATPLCSIPFGRSVLFGCATLERFATVALGNGHRWFLSGHGRVLITVVSKGRTDYAYYHLLFGSDCGRSDRRTGGTYVCPVQSLLGSTLIRHTQSVKWTAWAVYIDGSGFSSCLVFPLFFLVSSPSSSSRTFPRPFTVS